MPYNNYKHLKQKCFTYIALGDSVAYGLGATNYYGYVNYFRDFLETLNYCVNLTNRAIPHFTSTDLLQQLQQYNNIRQEVKDADLITISIGGPNLSDYSPDPTYLNDEVAIFTQNWTQILEEIRKSIKSKTNILVMTVYNPIQYGDPHFSVLEQTIQQINQILNNPKYRSKYQYMVVDVYSSLKGHFSDGRCKVCTWTGFYETPSNPHPTDAGHLEISRLHQLKYLKHLYDNDLPLLI